MGGSKRHEIEADANKIVLCRACHAEVTEQRWRLTRSPEELTVVAVATGELLARRRFHSAFSPSRYFHDVNVLEQGVDDLLRGIPYLTDDQLVELFGELRGLNRRTWVLQAAICSEAKRRFVHGDRAWEAMGRTLGMGWRQAYNLARVWDTFFVRPDGEFCNRLQNSALEESTWYVAASCTSDPQFWLAYGEDRKAEQPSYTIADFRSEIAAAGAALSAGVASGCVAAESGPCRIVRVYCNRSRKVIPTTGCSACALVAAGGEVERHDTR
jgi:hypothetical protein